MAEYIDKQALITEIQSSVSMVLQTAPYEKVWFDRFVDRQNEIMAIIERQPTAEVEPVVRGRWIDAEEPIPWLEDDVDIVSYCSICGAINGLGKTTYCPNCGARMDLGGADNG